MGYLLSTNVLMLDDDREDVGGEEDAEGAGAPKTFLA